MRAKTTMIGQEELKQGTRNSRETWELVHEDSTSMPQLLGAQEGRRAGCSTTIERIAV